jgi:hypothetical protein
MPSLTLSVFVFSATVFRLSTVSLNYKASITKLNTSLLNEFKLINTFNQVLLLNTINLLFDLDKIFFLKLGLKLLRQLNRNLLPSLSINYIYHWARRQTGFRERKRFKLDFFLFLQLLYPILDNVLLLLLTK